MAEIIIGFLLLGLLIGGGFWLYESLRKPPVAPAARILTPHITALACAGAQQSVWDWDRARHRFFLGAPLEERLGYEEGTFSGDDQHWVQFIHPDDRKTCLAEFENHAHYKNSAFRIEFRLRHQAGYYLWIELNASMVGTRCIGLAGDITERKRAEEALLLGAIYDPLTGLPNRALLLDRLDSLMSTDSQGFTLALLDIRGFRALNESLGHIAGDRFLRTIAERLTSLVPSGGSVARIGADVFGLLSPPQFTQAMPALMERVRDHLSEPVHLFDQEVVPIFALGWADSSDCEKKGTALMDGATAALQRSRQEGGIVRFVVEMKESDNRPMVLSSDLRKALSRHEIMLHYQPIIRLSDTKACGFEALMRWRHPRFGWVSPLEFIPLAEASGLIESLGRFALSEAAKALAHWQLTYRYQPPLFVTVNLSRRELFRDGLASDVQKAITQNFLEAGQIKLEITESLVMQHPDRAKHVLGQLRLAGAHIAIDDFGVGYSSLGWLQHLPFDVLKLDRTLLGDHFIDEQMADKPTKTGAIISAITSMAHAMGVSVVAEGTDNSKKAIWLHKTGCDYAQGFYYAHPMDKEKVLSFLPRNRPR